MFLDLSFSCQFTRKTAKLVQEDTKNEQIISTLEVYEIMIYEKSNDKIIVVTVYWTRRP